MAGALPVPVSAAPGIVLFSALEAQAIAIGERDAQRPRGWFVARDARLPLTNPRLEALRLLVMLARAGRVEDLAAHAGHCRAAGLCDDQVTAVIVAYGPAMLRRTLLDAMVAAPVGEG